MTVATGNEPQAYNNPLIAHGNLITGVIKSEIYQPDHCDPINARGVISTVRVYGINWKLDGSGRPQQLAHDMLSPSDIYGSGHTGSTNYERLRIQHDGSNIYFQSQSGGTGTAEDILFQIDGTTRYKISRNSTHHAFTGAMSVKIGRASCRERV